MKVVLAGTNGAAESQCHPSAPKLEIFGRLLRFNQRWVAQKYNSQVLNFFRIFHLNSNRYFFNVLFFRMHSLKASSDNFPTSLILLHSGSENSTESVIGHCKVSPMHRFPKACFIETGKLCSWSLYERKSFHSDRS